MADFIKLTCPSCNGKLKITDDIDRFACAHCGTEFLVNRKGGIISLHPIVNELKNVKKGVDKTASELAIKRLDKEISEIAQKIKNLEANKYEPLKSSFGGFISAVLFTAFYLWVDSDPYIICVGLLILVDIGTFIFLVSEINSISEFNDRIDNLHNQKVNKIKQLQRHRRIVDE